MVEGCRICTYAISTSQPHPHLRQSTRAALLSIRTLGARETKVGKPLELVDGPTFAALVRTVQSTRPASIPKTEPRPATTEPTCPLCNAPMVIRTAKRGANAGNLFFGCSRFSSGCRGTRPA